ncbi:MAG TPA: hypothetical protein VNT60_04305 [Deinococcales bacterium]|nr:hypothetical protein [Deinococcales bacterium]
MTKLENSRIKTTLLAATTALALVGAGVTAAPAIPEHKVSAFKKGFVAPLIAQSGLNTFNLVNNGQSPASLLLARINDGLTFEQVMDAFAKNPGEALAMVQLGGGVFDTVPGASNQATLDLKAGTYAVISGQNAPRKLVVTDRRGDKPSAPAASATVVLKDFAFDMPETVKAGKQVWHVENKGRQAHEFIVVKLQAGKSIEDVKAFLESQDGQTPPPGEFLGGALPFAGGYQAFVTVDLPAGEYYALCFMPDMEGGKPSHVHAGMAKAFKVIN